MNQCFVCAICDSKGLRSRMRWDNIDRCGPDFCCHCRGLELRERFEQEVERTLREDVFRPWPGNTYMRDWVK